MAAERRFNTKPQWPQQLKYDGRWRHGDAERGQEATQGGLHLPQLQRVGRKVQKAHLKVQIYWDLRCSAFNLLCLTEVRVWGRRSNIYVTLLAVARCTERRLTSEPTFAGTAESDPSSATGCSVERDSPGVTSSRDTGGHTRVSGHLISYN